jgi:hypothetical protein
MKKWTISVLDSEIYKDVEAETEKEAIEKILELWAKRIPEIAVEEEGKERVGTKCDSCPYYWEEADEDSPRCHYEWDDRYAPCEIDDFEEPEEEDDYPELVFDPEEER